MEKTNEPYAVTMIAGIERYNFYNKNRGTRSVSIMPSNLYGPTDNYDLANSHVLPALIRKNHVVEIRGDSEYVVWGSSSPMREFIYVGDVADAYIFLLENSIHESIYNIGSGTYVTMREFAKTVMDVIGFTGTIVFDASKPDITSRKLLDVSRMISLGWKAKISLREGIALAYREFLEKHEIGLIK